MRDMKETHPQAEAFMNEEYDSGYSSPNANETDANHKNGEEESYDDSDEWDGSLFEVGIQVEENPMSLELPNKEGEPDQGHSNEVKEHDASPSAEDEKSKKSNLDFSMFDDDVSRKSEKKRVLNSKQLQSKRNCTCKDESSSENSQNKDKEDSQDLNEMFIHEYKEKKSISFKGGDVENVPQQVDVPTQDIDLEPFDLLGIDSWEEMDDCDFLDGMFSNEEAPENMLEENENTGKEKPSITDETI